jgi:hypothetical protein
MYQEDAMMNWATSVRVALSNEPARQWFSNQIKDGYHFLDNFLDNHTASHGYVSFQWDIECFL